MAKKISNNRSLGQRFLLFFVTRVLVLLVIAGLIYGFWSRISSWISSTTTSFFQIFGFGIVLVAIALLLIVEVTLTKPQLFLRFWNKWIGSILVLVAIWGILAFFEGGGRLVDYSLGGAIGQSIIGDSLAAGISIVLVLAHCGRFFHCAQGLCRFAGGCCHASLQKSEERGASGDCCACIYPSAGPQNDCPGP